MTYALAFASLIVFAIGFRLAGIVPVASAAMVRARAAVATLADKTKSEDEKERASREAAVALFGRFFVILALTAAAVLPSVLLLYIFVWAGLADQSSLLNALVSPWIIASAVLIFIADYLIRR
jgi:hypothetical protein